MLRMGCVGGIAKVAIFGFFMVSCGEGGGSLGSGGGTGGTPSVGGGGGSGGVGIGQIDTTFGQDGGTITPIASSGGKDIVNGVAIQPDGKIVLAGHSENDGGTGDTDFAVARYNSDGLLDDTFDGDGKATTFIQDTSTPADGFGDTNAIAYAVAVQSDGKIAAAGTSDNDFALIRYNHDGTPDLTFSGDGIVVTAVSVGVDVIRAMALQSDGKILVAGESDGDFVVARYNTNDGALDPTFSGDGLVVTPVSGGVDVIRAMVLQSDGKILVAGESGGHFVLARYSATGVLDTTFDSDGIVDGGVGGANAMALQADGKIVVGGFVSNNNLDFALRRFDVTGAPDSSFGLFGKVVTSIGSGDAVIHGLAIQSSGKIVAAGFVDSGTDSDFALVGYTATGGLDTTFGETGLVVTPISPADDEAAAVALQTDGKIVVAGSADEDFVVVRYDPPGL